jgi:hypothetical protein
MQQALPVPLLNLMQPQTNCCSWSKLQLQWPQQRLQ